MRNILIATVGRSDYGIYRQVMERIDASSKLDYQLIVSGAHLSKKGGHTIDEIRADGRRVAAEVPLPETSSGQAQMAAAMGVAISGTADYLASERPDVLLVVGDRFEMFAIAAATVPFNIPIAHIHGGELSFGAIDDVFRHAITKMSHLHFAATRDYRARIIRMGEEPWRVTVSGAPALDNVRLADLPDRATLEQRFGIPLERAPILVTFHPVTRRLGEAEREVLALLEALRRFDTPIVFTAPNADAGGAFIRVRIEEFCQERSNSFLVESFGALNYLAMLREASALVGNSSSGLIEAPSFMLPTVNIGDRQQGRTRASNVIDVDTTVDEILRGIRTALDPRFRQTLVGLVNPYGDGHAAERIVRILEGTELSDKLVAKKFYDGIKRRCVKHLPTP